MALSNKMYTEDEYLFSLLQRDDADAFTKIYNKYHKILFALAFDYLRDRNLAEDIIQQVFLRLWEQRTRLLVRVNLGNYLYTITKNLVLKTIQERNKEVLQAYEVDFVMNISHGNMTEKVRSEKEIEELYEAIDKLPEQKKAVCRLKLEEELSNQQISDKLGISVKTVKSHYNQAIRFLRFHLKEKLALFFFTICIICLTGVFI
ncbi:RNA polymerase sigma factor [Parabacteroides sp.]